MVVLIVFRSNARRKSATSLWNIGVLLVRHPITTVTCQYIDICNNEIISPTQYFKLSENAATYHFYDNNDNMSITYINIIHDDSCGSDGFLESNVNSPDDIFEISPLPFKSLQYIYMYTQLQVDIHPLYKIL